MTNLLTDDARIAALDALLDAGWAHDPARDAIAKTYKFKSFTTAFGWMTQAAIWAEKLNHHPEWFNVYGRVDVVLTTHAAGGLTDLDVRLAQRLDKLAERMRS